MLVVIEGIDGSGKGTQAALLEAWAKEIGLKTALFSFPAYDKTKTSEFIIKMLNGAYGAVGAIDRDLRMLAFAADRFECKPLLLEALNNNDLVIIDRYVASNAAYQGFGLEGKELDGYARKVAALEFEAYGLPRPDLTYLLVSRPEFAQVHIANKAPRSFVKGQFDQNERNTDLQFGALQNYLLMSQLDCFGQWLCIDVLDAKGTFFDKDLICNQLKAPLAQALNIAQ